MSPDLSKGSARGGAKNPEKSMTFTEHLEELRLRLILSLIYLIVGVIVASLVARQAIGLLARPFTQIEVPPPKERVLKVRVDAGGTLRFVDPANSALFKNAAPGRLDFYLPGSDPRGKPDFAWGRQKRKPVFFSPLDPVWLYFYTALLLGAILALPFILHQTWRFVAPGLKQRERRAAVPLLVFGCVLFPAGAAFAYFLLKPFLNFLVNFQVISMEPQLEIKRFLGFELQIMAAFGLIFEFPLVIMFLVLIGVVHPRQLRKWRAYAIVVIAIVSMGLTPGPDPISMLIMMAPLIILYEVSIWLSVPLARKREARVV